jgi:hypothetical protein
MSLHLIKLCVGCDTVEDLLAWRAASSQPGEPWILRTRQTPRRADELVAGGSLYRVYKGMILSRQRILKVGSAGEGAASRCEVRLDEAVIRTVPTPRRAFQGWRYLNIQDAPADLAEWGVAEAVPTVLATRLRELGAW